MGQFRCLQDEERGETTVCAVCLLLLKTEVFTVTNCNNKINWLLTSLDEYR